MSGIGCGIGRVRNNQARTMLVAGEAALAAVLVVGSALLIRASLAAGRPTSHPASLYRKTLPALTGKEGGGQPQVFPRE